MIQRTHIGSKHNQSPPINRLSVSNNLQRSDGPQPHLVTIEFQKKTAVQCISIYADYKQDESYTPSKVSVKAGTSFYDLLQITTVDLDEPSGWVDIELLTKDEKPIKAFVFQIAVLANHQNGRDTHIRQIKIYEPDLAGPTNVPEGAVQFQTVDYTCMQNIR